VEDKRAKGSASDKKMTVHLLISGFVQGVGYRQFVKRAAVSLGLVGWVRNLPDRRVEALVTGSKTDLRKLIDRCKKGSFLSRIDNIQADWLEKEEVFDGFKTVV
jgi:acylphosphatase